MTTDTRMRLHQLVDALPDDDLGAALRLLEELASTQPSGPRDYDDPGQHISAGRAAQADDGDD